MALPKILARRTVARSRLFQIEELDLEFPNGQTRTYERLPGFGTPAVIVVAVTPTRDLLLIREYAAGFHERQLTLPKGAAETGESLAAAAERELKEEVGFGAKQMEFIKRLTLSPGHMGFTINVMLATDLYPERLPGDEPEVLEVVRWPLTELAELISHPEFNEARAIAALALVAPRLAED